MNQPEPTSPAASLSDELAREEAKRLRMWDPVARWKLIQETIAWIDQQQPIPRNSKAGALREQARKLAAFPPIIDLEQ